MLRLGSRVIAAVLVLCLSGCVEQIMTIKTDPPGAMVYMNDQQVGRTPLTTDFIWYGDYQVEVRKDGYETLKTHKVVKAPWWNWFPIDFFADVIPVWYRDHQNLSFALKPSAGPTTQPEAIIERAEEFKQKLKSSKLTRPPSSQPATKATSKPSKKKQK